MTKAAESVNCETCGACCRASSFMEFPLRPFADMTDTEAQEIEEKHPGSVTLTVPSGWTFDPQRFVMAIKSGEHGRCVALKGKVGKKVSCAIYEDRPSTCREFEPGSEHCLEARRKSGMRLLPMTEASGKKRPERSKTR